jgi:hypothetical protein
LANVAASLAATLDGSSLVQSTTSGAAGLTIHYDAASATYSLDQGAGQEGFGPADLGPAYTLKSVYSKTTGSGTDTLSLTTNFSQTSDPYPYGGIGVWQQSSTAGGSSSSNYTMFTYGIQTPAANMPLAGLANYYVDFLGYVSEPSKSLKAINGQGVFQVDFLADVFKFTGYTNEADLSLTVGSAVPGPIEFVGAGHLGNDASLQGKFTFTDTIDTYVGAMNGLFYGPAADNVGATFNGSSSAGGGFVASLIGPQYGAAPSENLAMTDIVVQQAFAEESGVLATFAPSTGFLANNGDATPGTMTLGPDGTVQFSPGSYWTSLSAIPQVQTASYSAADMVASSRPNFTSYQATVNGQPTELDVYKVGSGNTELALTYLDLSIWSEGVGSASEPDKYQLYSVFGVPTSTDILKGLTGSAQYAGVVYGGAIDGQANRYDVTGTSTFQANFSTETMTATLTMNGANVGGGAGTTFGPFNFMGPIAANTASLGLVQTAPGPAGLISAHFYGPAAEELGGTFLVTINDGATEGGATIAGAVAAKKQ